MSFYSTVLGCGKWPHSRLTTDDRHWGHWRYLLCLPQYRYVRALRLWHRLYGVRPRGLVVDGNGVRLNFERA